MDVAPLTAPVHCYRERLRLEGLVLAGCGAVSAVSVLLLGADASRAPASTMAQLLAVAAVMATLGRRSVSRALRDAVDITARSGGSGQPTAPWKLVLIVAVLTLGFGFAAGWDAGLRIGGGCMVVGLAQAITFERLVAREEARAEVRFYRVPGSRLFTGTRLGLVRSP